MTEGKEHLIVDPNQSPREAVRRGLAQFQQRLQAAGLRAVIDGAGIMSLSMEIAAPYLTQGTLKRVLSPWITGRVSLYAALPSRKFIPDRTRIFLEYLIEQTRLQTETALQACAT
jgi:DNA-binding transcriptional LysR family regulator